MLKWIIITPVAILFFLAGFLFFRLGFNQSVKTIGPQAKAFHFLYVDHTGPYHKIVDKIQSVESLALKENFDCRLTFGRYLDDPNKVPEDRLRSQGGCVLDKAYTNQLPEGFKVLSLQEQKYLVLEFDGSPMVGPWKVYPKAQEWAQENQVNFTGSTIEVYEVTDETSVTTTYYFQL